MSCECGSERIISLSGKTSDLANTSYNEFQKDGYVPYDLGIGGGDYIEFEFCADCGKIQDFHSLTDEEIASAIVGDEE